MKNKKILTLFLIFAILFSFGISANAQEEKTVNLGGQTVGIALYTKGLLVTDILSFEDTDSNFVMPANDAKIRKGDYILKANGVELKDISNLDAVISSSNGKKIDLICLRNNEQFDTTIIPQKSKDEEKFKLGLMLRDSAAGIGTVTFSYNNKYMALGHSINDADLGTPLTVSEGRIVKCTVTGVNKGEVQKPGELKGVLGVNAEILGTIENNTDFGIYGITNDYFSSGKSIKVAEKESVSVGKASIFSDFEGNDLKEYSIEISKINSLDNNTSRNFLIKITDEHLIDKTGGIVQGLSGSPIVQNGKLVGAVTHVLLSDPTKGYGIYIQNMLNA